MAWVAVTDMKTGKLVTTFPIGDGVDANRFDPASGYVFASNGQSGTLTVAHEDTPDKYSVLDNVPTAKGARTMELDPKTPSRLRGLLPKRSRERPPLHSPVRAPCRCRGHFV